jgi:GxxExxY protein
LDRRFTAEVAEFTEKFNMTINQLSEKAIGLCIEIHRNLGPGLLESAYEECLCYELSKAEIPFERQKPVSVKYK